MNIIKYVQQISPELGDELLNICLKIDPEMGLSQEEILNELIRLCLPYEIGIKYGIFQERVPEEKINEPF